MERLAASLHQPPSVTVVRHIRQVKSVVGKADVPPEPNRSFAMYSPVASGARKTCPSGNPSADVSV